MEWIISTWSNYFCTLCKCTNITTSPMSRILFHIKLECKGENAILHFHSVMFIPCCHPWHLLLLWSSTQQPGTKDINQAGGTPSLPRSQGTRETSGATSPRPEEWTARAWSKSRHKSLKRAAEDRPNYHQEVPHTYNNLCPSTCQFLSSLKSLSRITREIIKGNWLSLSFTSFNTHLLAHTYSLY